MRHFSVVTLAGLTLVGCYTPPPPQVPHVEAPKLEPGVAIELDAATSTERRNVTDSDRVCVGSSCSNVSVTSKQNVRVHHAEASFAGQPLTLGQVAIVADPSYTSDLARLDALSATCKHGFYWEVGGQAGVSIGMIVAASTSNESGKATTGNYVGAGIAAAGLVTWALGRFVFGGQACGEANDLYHARRHQYENADKSYFEGDRARDLEKLVEQYNAKLPAQEATR